MKPTIFLLFFVLTTAVHAYDCTFLGSECEALNQIDENMVANLIYTNTSYADHSFVYDYNSKIIVNSAPANNAYHYKGIITGAWFDILTVMPSVIFNNSLLVSDNAEIRSEYGYGIQIPANYYNNNKRDGSTCQILYSLYSKSETLNFKKNSQYIGNSKKFSFGISEDSLVQGTLTIKATQKNMEYEWDRYCCRRYDGRCTKYCYACDYARTTYTTYNLDIVDEIALKHYSHEPDADFEFISKYYDSTKGILSKDDETSVILSFNNSLYQEQEYQYSAEFSKKPHYFLTIKADVQKSKKSINLLRDNMTFFVKDTSECTIESSDLFRIENKECSYELKGEEIKEFEKVDHSKSWNLLFIIAIFLLICSIIYATIKS